jgi:hypothetical protein
MPRARDKTLARIRAKTTTEDTAAACQVTTMRARLKLAATLRETLAQLGVDPAKVAMLGTIEADAEGLAIGADDAAATGAPPASGQADVSLEAFWARIAQMGQRQKPDLDLSQASLAETLAWCLAHAG